MQIVTFFMRTNNNKKKRSVDRFFLRCRKSSEFIERGKGQTRIFIKGPVDGPVAWENEEEISRKS